jgi:hypothetical protein
MTVFTGSSYFSELKEIKDTLEQIKQIKGIKKVLQRKGLISKVKQSNTKLLFELQTYQVSLQPAMRIVCLTCPPKAVLTTNMSLAMHAERLKVCICHIASHVTPDE